MARVLKSEIRRLREMEILSKLDRAGMLTVDQFQKWGVCGFGECGRRNVLRVLGRMEADGSVVSRVVGGVKVFAPVGSRFGFAEHVLLRNDYLIYKGWMGDSGVYLERPVTVGGVEVIRPDAIVRLVEGIECIEIDRMAKRKDNLQKIQTYKKHNIKFRFVCYRERASQFKGCPVDIVEDWR